MKIRNKYSIVPEPEPTIDNKLELIKYLAQVQSRVKEDITSDFTYARLGDKDKKLIIEMASNAYYGRKLYKIISLTYTKWNWNKNKRCWERRYLDNEDKIIINQYGQNQFDSFMTRPTMLANLNRNVKDNYLIQYSVNAQTDTEDEQVEETKQNDILKRMGKLLQRNDNNQKKEVGGQNG